MPAIVPKPRPPTAMSWASSPAARRTMQGNRRRDTVPELRVRQLLHRSGLRFRVDWPLPIDRRRRADIAFPRVKIVVFIDGCFWHRCPEHYIAPKSNATFWDAKTLLNAERDQDTNSRLEDLGWVPLRFWEHHGPELVVETIRRSYVGRCGSEGL